MDYSPRFPRDLRAAGKRHPAELSNALLKLDTYFLTLDAGADPRRVDSVRFRREPKGVIAFDERGSKTGSSEEDKEAVGKRVSAALRLYAFPDDSRRVLFLLAIRDKSSQSKDLRYCSDDARELEASRPTKEEQEPED